MKLYFITFRSVTFAQRAEKLLLNSGFPCSLQRTPRWMEEQGCGYALRVSTREISAAVELLRRENVMLRRVYIQRPEGQLEELRL